MKTLNVIISCLFLSFACGCFLGDKVGNGREFSVQLLPTQQKRPLLTKAFSGGHTAVPPSQQKGTLLTTNSLEVQNSLRLVGDILVKNGLVLKPNPPSATNAIAYYSKEVSSCGIYLTDNEIIIFCFEYSRGVPSADFKNWTAVLNQELIDHYGAQNVKVRR